MLHITNRIAIGIALVVLSAIQTAHATGTQPDSPRKLKLLPLRLHLSLMQLSTVRKRSNCAAAPAIRLPAKKNRSCAKVAMEW